MKNLESSMPGPLVQDELRYKVQYSTGQYSVIYMRRRNWSWTAEVISIRGYIVFLERVSTVSILYVLYAIYIIQLRHTCRCHQHILEDDV